MSEASVKSMGNENLHLVILNGTTPNEPPAIMSVTVNVSGSEVDNVLVCDIWKSGSSIVAKPVATLLPSEVNGVAIKASNVGEIAHHYMVLEECHIQPSFPIEIFNKSKEVKF